MIKCILLKIGLNHKPHDPCLLYGILTQPSSHTNLTHSTSQLHIGLNVYAFVFYLSDPLQEDLLKTPLQDQIKVDFMGNVDYFLVKSFNWLYHKEVKISVQLCKS